LYLKFLINFLKFQLTSVEVTKAFIERIKQINPITNCVVDELFTEALNDAAAADKLIESGTMTTEQLIKEKPFLGVPISTKDCLRVKGLLHTAGIYNRKHVRGETDSEAMRLMREAGAIPFALTNVSEVCMWWESYNMVHGRSNNPYDTYRIVGGSSGGEGCLQASSGSPFGLGSDIGGSIRMPAFFNGVFGHKPSKFVVSNEGQYPEPHTYEQDAMLAIGPMSRFATDLKPMLRIIAKREKLPLLRLDEPIDLSKVKIYYQETDNSEYSTITPVDKDILASMQKVVRHFKNTVKCEVNRVCIDALKKSTVIWMANMTAEKSAPGFDEQLVNLEGKINIWKEAVKWLFGQSNHTLAGLMTATIEKFNMAHGSEKHQYLIGERNR
jgi:fatty acid amide hydrolase 2